MKKVCALYVVLCLFIVTCTAVVTSAFATDTVWDIEKNVYMDGDVAVTEVQRATALPIFEIKLENGGVIRGELYPDVAPEAVGNFIALANSGFYDGLIFHRVIPGFMIQGGCPLGMGYGGPGWSIKGEFALNQVENNLRHTYGILSMARSEQLDSAGSQFFIMVSDSPSLDGSYAAFGKVLEGMELADAIVSTPRNDKNKPDIPQVMTSIRVETFGKEYPFTKI